MVCLRSRLVFLNGGGGAGRKREPLLQFVLGRRIARNAGNRRGPGQRPPRKGSHAAQAAFLWRALGASPPPPPPPPGGAGGGGGGGPPGGCFLLQPAAP